MKKILVPCDFSNTSIQAFRFACQIAALSKGEIFVLNVIELPAIHGSSLVPVRAYENAFLKEVKSKAREHFNKLKEKWAGKLTVHLYVEHGSVKEGVSKFVDRKRIDLIVMGTHGSSGIREYTVGSNAEKIVRSSRVPVITVKKLVNVTTVRNIIFPTDFTAVSKGLISAIKTLQSFFKARLHILYINVPSNFTPDYITEKRLAEFGKENQFRNYSVHIYNHIDEESGILNFQARHKNSIIAMSTHGRKGLNHLLRGSIAEDVVNHIPCPIWTLAEK